MISVVQAEKKFKSCKLMMLKSIKKITVGGVLKGSIGYKKKNILFFLI